MPIESQTTNPSPKAVKAANQGLLPVGLQDQLPPDAEREASVLESLMGHLGQNGYDRVKPPLLEFENTLMADAPAKVRRRSFRVVDPHSRETLVLRSDITVQVIRMASTRLAAEQRPLRLCYGGQVVRVSGSELRPERQFTQVGAEILGLDAPAKVHGVIEAAGLALRGLGNSGVNGLVLDLVLPDLVPRVIAGHNHMMDDALSRAIAARDPMMLKDAACADCVQVLSGLMASSGPWRASLAKVQALGELMTAQEVDALTQAAESLEAEFPGVELTLDPVETRGFEYHNTLGFVLFARDVRGELGRGGCYDQAEAGAGFTLYLDTVVRALGPADAHAYLFVPYQHLASAMALVDQGHRVRRQLGPSDGNDVETAARQAGCKAWFDGEQVRALS